MWDEIYFEALAHMLQKCFENVSAVVKWNHKHNSCKSFFKRVVFALNNNSNAKIFRGTQDKRERGGCGKTSTFIFENDLSCAHLAFISFSFFLLNFFGKSPQPMSAITTALWKKSQKVKIKFVLEDNYKTNKNQNETNFFPGVNEGLE